MGSRVVLVQVLCCLVLFSGHTARSDGSRNKVKLPSHLKPIHYRVRLMPFIWPGNFTTAGQLDLLVECLHSSHNVTLNALEIDVLEDSVHIFVQDGEDNLGREIPLDPQRKLQINSKELIIKTSEELEAGSKYRIQMKFVALLNDRLQGFYRSSYVDEATGERRWIAVSQLAPLDARRSFPCYDGLEFKAKFEFSLARTTNMTSLSNMPLDRSEPVEGMPGWVWDHYQTTPPMSIFLAGYLVSDFVPLQKYSENDLVDCKGSVPVSIWSRSDVVNETDYAASIAPRILHFYEEYFKFPYPLPKLDFVALPEFIFTTMENWGLITFRESMILFDPRETTTRTKQRIAMDIAHELAHQWFGNLVSPFWWDDVWLNECFANYMEYVGAEYVEPTWRLSDQFPFNEIQNVFFLDALESSHPVHMEVDDPDYVEEIYDSVSYIKGPSLFRMLNHSLRENTFRSGLTLYYKAHNYSVADKDDLWESLTTQAHLDGSLPNNMTVKEIIDTWILQTGYPVVKVDRNYESGSMTFSQERFLLYRKENGTKSEKSTSWWVPITYTTQEDPDFTNTMPSLWMNPNEENTNSVHLSPGEKWVFVNIQEAGYYRVNYDALNWKLLTDQLRSQAGSNEQVIPPSARSQLLDDAFNLARSGLLPYSTALDLCLTLRHDTDYLPWASTFRALEFLDEMLTNTPVYGTFKELMLGLSRELVESVGWQESNQERDHIKSLSRNNALRWSCLWGDEKCIDEAKKLFSKLMKANETSHDFRIAPDLRDVVYCNGIRYGSTKEWEFALQRYLDSNVGGEKSALWNALGCTKELPLIMRYLDMMLNSSAGISNQDGRIIFNTMINNPLANSLLFVSLKDNWDGIWKLKRSNLQELNEMIVASTKYMNSQDELNQLKQLWEDHHNHLGPMKKQFEQALVKVEGNVNWVERSYKEVKIWLENH